MDQAGDMEIEAKANDQAHEDALFEQSKLILATWFDQFADPYSWEVENYDRFVEFACGCKYPAPPIAAWGTRCPQHDNGVIRIGPYRVRRG